MSTELLTNGVIGLIMLALMWQQNRILRRQNEILAQDAGVGAHTVRATYWRYWPMLAMGVLALLIWTAVAVDYYYVRPPNALTQKEIPEFDEQTNAIVLSYGQDTPNSCTATVDGTGLMSRKDGYKLAVACWASDGTRDILDLSYLQVSNLYDIREGAIQLRCPYKE